MASQRGKKISSAKNNHWRHIVNKRTAYEIIIAEKAEQQPLPDMADAIWAAVSAGLITLPSPPGESQVGPATPAAKSISAWHFVLYGTGVAVIITIAVLLWWNRQAGRPLPQKRQPAPARTTPLHQPLEESPHRDSIRLKPSGTPFVPSKKEKPAVIDSTRKINDTQLVNRVPGAIQITPLHLPSIIIPDTASAPSPPAKKPRGVKGINDSDYKIVPTIQDSSLPIKKGN
jgi:hypothetical protein